MMKIAVCDRNRMVNQILCDKVHTFGERIHVDMMIHSYTDGKKIINSQLHYDLALLEIGEQPVEDIQNSFLLRHADRQVKIDYVSRLESYMKEAFQVHAFAYLKKPIVFSELYKVLYDALIYGEKEEQIVPFVTFWLRNGKKTFLVQEIMYFEYCNRNVLIHECTGKVYEIHGEKISNIAQKMKKFNFEVPHKSFVVNLMQIAYIKGYFIHLKNGVTVPLSQQKSKNFRRLYQQIADECKINKTF